MDTIGPGHNSGDPVAMLHENLPSFTSDLRQRADDLMAGVARVPATLDAVTVGRAADFVKQLGVAVKQCEERRTATKQPYIEAGKVIDGAFKTISDRLAAGKREVEAKIHAHQQRVAAEERRKREEEARRLAEEAKRAEAAAQTGDALDEAIAAHGQAAAARAATEVKTAEIARARGEYGAVATVRTTWHHEVTNVADVPREYLMPNDAAIKAAIKAAANPKALVIPGVRIYSTDQTVIR